MTDIDTALTLDQAADALGVHYQTAYKWVRAGRLPAVRIGGAYRIDVDDLERFEARRQAPAPPPKRRPRLGFDRLADRFYDALLVGDDNGARKLVSGLLDDGVSMTEVSQKVLAPAMRRIGDEWYAGRLAISLEHRATAMVERIVGEHLPNPRGRRRGRAVVAAVTGDRHSLPTLFAAAALRDDNWQVDHLGADVPPEEIVAFVDRGGIDLVVLTIAATDAASTAGEVAAELGQRSVRVLLGSPGSALSDLQSAARNK